MSEDNVGRNKRTTAWCFTINNPESDALFAALPERVAYVIWQRERGEEGTEHLQGYIRFARATTFAGVKAVVGERAHIEPRRGSEEQAVAYCSKEDTRVRGPWSFGERAAPGKRNDLAATAARVLATGDVRDADPAMFAKYSGGLQKLALRVAPPRRKEVKVVILWGKTGTGKTYNVFNSFPDVFRPAYGNSGLWWDGYCGQEAVLFDEFIGQVPLGKLLRLLDPYGERLEIKGGFETARYTTVFITSNKDPRDWYTWKSPDEHAALMRRCGLLLGDPDRDKVYTSIECVERAQVAEDFMARCVGMGLIKLADAPAPAPVQEHEEKDGMMQIVRPVPVAIPAMDIIEPPIKFVAASCLLSEGTKENPIAVDDNDEDE